jgi:hypothetical protein
VFFAFLLFAPGLIFPDSLTHCMTINYTIDGNFLRSEMAGSICAEDIRQYWKRLAEDPRYANVDRALVNLTKITGEFDSEKLRNLAYQVQKLKPSRRALVVREDYFYGMVRMFIALSEPGPVEYKIFRDSKSALAWLNSPGHPAVT